MKTAHHTTTKAAATTATAPTITTAWTPMEHTQFRMGLQKYGRSWMKISKHLVLTRTPEQVKAYASEYYALQEAQALAVTSTTTTKPNDKAKARAKDGHWTDAEHELFLQCWDKYGKSWKKISQVMKTRSNEQIRTHAQKYFTKLDQLRTCGYNGEYTMDGTRHLTRTFLKKAHGEGRLKEASWKPQFKVHNPRGLGKRRRNRHANALARLGGGKQRRYVHEEEEEDDDNETGATTYTTRSGRVVTWAHVKDDTVAEEEEGEEEDKTEDYPTDAQKLEVIFPMATEEEAEDEENIPAYDGNIQAVDDHHDAKQEIEHMDVDEGHHEAVNPPPPTPTTAAMLEELRGIADPMLNDYWGAHGLAAETHTSNGGSRSTSMSASDGSVDGTTTHAGAHDMLLMMSSGDGSLLWETGHDHAEGEEGGAEEDNNSLTRPPSWAAEEEELEEEEVVFF